MKTTPLSLVVLPSKNPWLVPGGLPLWRSCYELWDRIWFATLKELDGITRLHSDGFVQQDFLTVLLHEDRLTGFCSFKSVNLRNPAHRNDSWFAPWPPELLSRLAQNYHKGLVPSWLTVHPDFRRTNGAQNFRMTDVLSEIMHLACLEMGAEICFGTPRKDRSVHKALQQAGALCLKEDVTHHGVLIDLMAFIPSEAGEPQLSELSKDLWKNRKDFNHLTGSLPGTSIWEVPFEEVI